ncbi:MAG: glycosyltransferase family 2 protein [Planctomycetes bacterium]|nr:glycosyltransferase family 2 protein [Planctomycetota bacterium]
MKPAPELSLVIPCFNEEEVVEYALRELAGAFAEAGHDLTLFAVDNGSTDRTGEILARLSEEGLPIEVVRVAKNEGYGNGVLQGIAAARGAWIGMIPADGQVDASDVVRLFEVLVSSPRPMLGKVRRRFRMDGFRRKVMSVAYNVFVYCLWPRLGTIDVNGSPKIVPANYLRAMEIQSRRWFLDPEIMIKARDLDLPVLEMNVFARMRSAGVSHVRVGTCWEFFTKLIAYRLGGPLKNWRKRLASGAIVDPRNASSTRLEGTRA